MEPVYGYIEDQSPADDDPLRDTRPPVPVIVFDAKDPVFTPLKEGRYGAEGALCHYIADKDVLKVCLNRGNLMFTSKYAVNGFVITRHEDKRWSLSWDFVRVSP